MALSKFVNHSKTDFSDNEIHSLMKGALAYVRSELGKTYPILIADKKYNSSSLFTTKNPYKQNEIVGKFFKSEIKHVKKAIEVALEVLPEWKETDVKIRINYLLAIAEVLRQRQMDLASWMVFEVGMSWEEADQDVAKAIDYLEFYAREATRLAKGDSIKKIPTEKNELWYVPLGIGVVFPSWNKPLSNLVGMVTAAIAVGNTVLIKPSSNAPVIGYKFMEILREIEFPFGVVNYLPGDGSEIGDFLIAHSKIRFVAFSGNKQTGLHVHSVASKITNGQTWLKRIITDMGGKNAIIVDKTADLAKATKGIITSAFSFQGQKCSSVSHVIIDKTVYKSVVEKIIKETKKITIGNPTKFENKFGAVINEESQDNVLDYIKKGEKEGTLVLGGKKKGKRGFIIEPTIFTDVTNDACIVREEIMGPILAISKAKNFDQAVEMANNTEYGLVGAVYTKSTRNMRYAKENFEVGNLYFNRQTTDDLVDVHPFGGTKLSGNNTKSGGRYYLQLFTQPKLISSMR